jgi:hypothetical protein
MNMSNMRIIASLALGALTANARFEQPGDYQIIFYKDGDFTGETRTINIDPNQCYDFEATQVTNLKDLDFNDKITSYISGKNIIFDMCNNNPWDDCWGTNGNHGGYAAANGWVGWNDKMTTFRGGCVDPDKLPAMVFNDDGCRGDSIRVDLKDPDGTYWSKSDIEHGGLKNDRANSVMVPDGYSLVVYEDDGLRGNKQIMDG